MKVKKENTKEARQADPSISQSTTLPCPGSPNTRRRLFGAWGDSEVQPSPWGKGLQAEVAREPPSTYGSTAMAADRGGMPLFFPARLWQSW